MNFWRYLATHNKTNILLTLFGCFFFIWYLYAIPYFTALPKDFSYDAEMVSMDNFYDEGTASYLGEQYSDSTFRYNVVSIEGCNAIIDNSFDVRTQSGESIFSVSRTYGIDRYTCQHVPGLGDEDRSGYLFGPRKANKSDVFQYWHVNYDGPATMHFVDEERMYNLTVYHYRADYHGVTIDQTDNLSYLPGVPAERGVRLEPNLDIWIEPTTGYLVKYHDDTIAYYYDQKTGETIAPWNHFSNVMSEHSIRNNVIVAQDLKIKFRLVQIYIPLFLGILAFYIFLTGYEVCRKVTRWTVRQQPVFFSALLMAAASLVLVGWSTNTVWLTRIASGFSGMNPMTAISFMLLGLTVLSMKRWPKLSLATAVAVLLISTLRWMAYLGVVNFSIDLLLFKQQIASTVVPARLSLFTATNFIVLSTAALISYTRVPKKQLFVLLPITTFVVSVLAILAYLFKDVGVLDLPVFISVALHTAAFFVISSLIIGSLFGFVLDKRNILFLLPLVSFLLITLLLTAYITNLVQQRLEFQFGVETDRVEEAIKTRVDIYANTLAGGVGLFNASDRVSRAEFKRYVEGLQIQRYYPGIQGIGYAAIVNSEGDLIDQVRADGYPDFTIYPESDLDVRTSIIYLEPFDYRNQRAFGYDMFSDETRRNAMQQAIDSGTPSISGKVTLLQETDEDVQPGFLMYFPVYAETTTATSSVADKRENIVGFVYSPFRMNDFMQGIVGASSLDIDFHIYDGYEIATSTELYDNAPDKHPEDVNFLPEFRSESVIYVEGRPWTIEYVSLSSFVSNATERLFPMTIFISGTLLSILLTLVLYAMSTSRRQAIRLARQMTNDLRSSQKMLLEEKTRSEALLSSVGEGVIAIDVDGRIIYVNDEAVRLSKYRKDELVGANIYKVLMMRTIDGKSVSRVQRPICKSNLRQKTIVETNMQYVTAEGSLLPVAITASPIVAEGKLLGSLEVFRDVTAERQIDMAKSEFVSLASHQLRTPIAAIRWYLELLTDTLSSGLKKEEKEYLQEIEDATERMNELINSLLNISRLELGTFIINPQKMDIKKVINAAVKEQKLAFKAKKQVFKVVCEKQLPLISIDPQITHVIVQNLLSNANKYTPEKGKITLRISVVDAQDKKGYIKIVCEDNGYGIPEAEHAEIFKKMHRADNIKKLNVEGTGLGLYIVKTVVDAAGLTIGFTSKENKGTTFEVRIPLSGMKERKGTKPLDIYPVG